MSLPTLQKSWLFSTNNRISFVSLNDTMARFLFGIKNFLVATVGYTVKYSCDGVTGPTSSVDNTDRWISFSNCTTRGTTTTSPQSFVVLTDSSTAVFATGVLTTTANFANGETVTTGTKVYTFQTVLTNVDGNVLIGGSAAASLANLAAAINLGAGSGTAYAAATTANTFVSATSAPTTLTLTALVAGPAANTTATTETAANASFASATLTGGSGVDILLTYQGAADHLCKMSISVGALFTPAGTPTNQPTATDELVNFPNTGIAASTVIDSTASGDRVFHLMATTDKRGFRCFIYRQNVMISWIAVEVITSSVTAMSWPSKVLVWATNVSIGSSLTNGHVLVSSTTVGNGNGGGVRIGGTNIRADGGGFSIGGANNFLTQLTPTDMEAAPALGPLGLYSAIAAFQGKLGDRIDMYVPWANVVQGNVFGNSQWVYMGTAIHPWNSGPVILS
jgi:hypothetical protein